MNDRAVSLLDQYEIEVYHTRKGRGAILCDTNQGFLILKEYSGREERIALQNRLLTHIRQQGRVSVESIIPNREGTLLVRDYAGVPYVLKSYCEGRECNIYEKSECLEAVRLLAQLHGCMELPAEPGEESFRSSPGREYEKHNKELKKARKYLKQRSQKTWFEISLQQTYDYFLDQALRVTEDWKQYQELMERQEADRSTCTYCHGDYQYHNILHEENGWFVTNFEKCIMDSSIRDLYLLLRKLLEKSNWSVSLGSELLECYRRERPLSALEQTDLYYRLAYPEKFWKIVNFYFNSGKAWIPERNQEKLQKLMEQEPKKQEFLEQVLRH